MASAISTTPSVLARIEKGVMSQLLHDKADFAEKFMSFLVSRTIQVEADLVDQLFNSSEKRLARLLLLLANFNNDGELRMITKEVSRASARKQLNRPRLAAEPVLNFPKPLEGHC
jgi:CRP/FNR family transcriptional regulator, cyclic AMP receptor protein